MAIIVGQVVVEGSRKVAPPRPARPAALPARPTRGPTPAAAPAAPTSGDVEPDPFDTSLVDQVLQADPFDTSLIDQVIHSSRLGDEVEGNSEGEDQDTWFTVTRLLGSTEDLQKIKDRLTCEFAWLLGLISFA